MQQPQYPDREERIRTSCELVWEDLILGMERIGASFDSSVVLLVKDVTPADAKKQYPRRGLARRLNKQRDRALSNLLEEFRKVEDSMSDQNDVVGFVSGRIARKTVMDAQIASSKADILDYAKHCFSQGSNGVLFYWRKFNVWLAVGQDV